MLCLRWGEAMPERASKENERSHWRTWHFTALDAWRQRRSRHGQGHRAHLADDILHHEAGFVGRFLSDPDGEVLPAPAKFVLVRQTQANNALNRGFDVGRCSREHRQAGTFGSSDEDGPGTAALPCKANEGEVIRGNIFMTQRRRATGKAGQIGSGVKADDVVSLSLKKLCHLSDQPHPAAIATGENDRYSVRQTVEMQFLRLASDGQVAAGFAKAATGCQKQQTEKERGSSRDIIS